MKKQLTNARGQLRKYFYDAMGRITGYVGAEDSVGYTYDAAGNVLTVTDRNGTITREYDALNRITKYTDTFGKSIRYEYDAVGNLVKLIYPDDTAVLYAYDANNALSTVTDWAGRVTAYTYDANGKVTGVTKPDGSITTTVYDNRQRITSTVEKTSSGAVITGFEYTYDALGRIFVEKHLANGKKLCYTYDNLSRVTKRTVKNLSDVTLSEETFSYDAAGNLIGGTSETGFVYDTNNRLISIDGEAVSYDADGNMLSMTLDGEERSLAYDSANRLLKAGGCEYTYNAEDIRIRNLCGEDETLYTYDTNTKLSRLLVKTTNGTVTKYVYGMRLIGEETGGAFKTYHFDYRGSTVAITDSTGTVTDTFQYDTYGKQTARTGTSEVIFGYNGRDGVITDSNSLLYMRARYYSPELRRFINADIIAGEISNAITLNRYAYANGNPVSNVDPFGLSAEREANSKNEDSKQEIIDEFLKIYYDTYGKEYQKNDLSEVTIEKILTTVHEYEPFLNNAVISGVGILITAIAPYLGIATIPATIASFGFGVSAGSAVPGSGDYPTYVITKTGYHTYSVEVANYHGYRVYENRNFKYTITEKYYVMNGKISRTETSYTDEYLAYRYRNHP